MGKIRNCQYCGAFTLTRYCCHRCQYRWEKKQEALRKPSIADQVQSARRYFLRQLYVDAVNRGFDDGKLREHIEWMQGLSIRDLEKYYEQRKEDIIGELCFLEKEKLDRSSSCHEDAWIYRHCDACLTNPDDYKELDLDYLVRCLKYEKA